jgi:arginase
MKKIISRKIISLLGYASGLAAADTGCGDGPAVLAKSDLCAKLKAQGADCDWQEMFYPPAEKTVSPAVALLCARLAQRTKQLVDQQRMFTVFGGDHSCALGTWSGVSDSLKTQGALGLIWIDAHLDSHTPETTPSGNIHGMPLAALLGYGAAELTGIMGKRAKLQPQHVCIIGARSYEQGEVDLIKNLGVRVYKMPEIIQRGLEEIVQEARGIVGRGTASYGISIDLDAIDPREAPGVGSPEPNGLSSAELCRALTRLRNDSRLVGTEIAEFNPHSDRNRLSEKVIYDLLAAFFSA